MGIRDDEIRRLEKYAQGLGVKVSYHQYVKRSMDSAAWVIDGSQIVVFSKSGKSKTTLIMDLVHELGHHLAFVYLNRKIPKSVDNALEKEIKNIPLTLEDRKALFEWELLGMKYHDLIIKEVGIKIPKWKFKVENKLQEFVYNYITKHNKSPKKSIRDNKYKQLKKKYEHKRSNN